MHTIVNGLPASSIAIFDRGLQYGDGLFETLRLGIALPDIRQQVCEAIAAGAAPRAVAKN
ncbi:hypothetical protein [Xanthomonas albilineans]|uniref:hypothetical protein n=1 Tax=Xanthomonas albilineans TaxID=29447 RepID=UPI0005F357D6|nr:hypothetical protein [Xanthomonas albilineans]QHQ28243.1 hypothetical protein XaFJ1_GM001500 [Xanthomonas albilineans]